MEQHALETSLVFRGIPEDIAENGYNMRQKVYAELAHIFEGEDYVAKLAMARTWLLENVSVLANSAEPEPDPSLLNLNIAKMWNTFWRRRDTYNVTHT